ncbi:MAG: hypothetical protein F6K65_43650 [Moorea sp. SIO3C2]|nr:hypothetical protein [Moorena sp. SIO3C2]
MGNQISFPDSRLPITDSRFPTPDSRFPTPDSRFFVTLSNSVTLSTKIAVIAP